MLQSRDRHLAAKRCFPRQYRHYQRNIAPIDAEQRMRRQFDFQQQIALAATAKAGSTLAFDAQHAAFGSAGRHFDFQLLGTVADEAMHIDFRHSYLHRLLAAEV